MSGITNPLHLAFIAVIALVVLGPKRLPDLARTLGNGLREFRTAIGGMSITDTPEPPTPHESLTPASYPTEAAPPPVGEMSAGIATVAPAAGPTPTPTRASAAGTAAPSPSEQALAADIAPAPSPAEQELAGPPHAGS